MKKPYLLSISSETKGMSRYLESIKKLDVEHIAIQFEPFSNINASREIRFNQPYPGHIQKYAFIPRDLDPERYIVFADTDDVIFQKGLPELGEFDLYLAPENAKHRDTIWKQVIEETTGFEELMDEDIYNAGTFAMKVVTLYKMLDFMEESGLMGSTSLADQLLFNLFIRRNPKLSKVIDPTLFCPLFANYYRGASKVDDLWMMNGKVITVVHANGSPQLKEKL